MIDDDDGAKEHLHILITSPNLDDEVVTICVCSRHSRSETLLCLDVGDHEFIKHPSVVSFRHAKIRKTAAILAAVENGYARLQPKATEVLVARVRAAFLDSDFVANGVRSFFRETVENGF